MGEPWIEGRTICEGKEVGDQPRGSPDQDLFSLTNNKKLGGASVCAHKKRHFSQIKGPEKERG